MERIESKVRILLIDNNDSFTYNLVQLLEEEGPATVDVVPYQEVTPDLIDRYDKIMISPGPGLPEDFPNLMIWVRKFSAQKSILGVCLGHEAIALAYGGSLHHLGRVFHGVSKRTRIIQKDYLFQDVTDEFEAGLYHSWALDPKTFPGQLQVTAVAEDGVIMALSHKEYDLKGFQYHPESIMTGEGRKMIRNWLNSER
jgi:anthranilate synthase component 2